MGALLSGGSGVLGAGIMLIPIGGAVFTRAAGVGTAQCE